MGDDDAEDARLARRAAAHDPEAEAQLARRLYPRVRAYGRVHLGDETSAAELAQEVLIVLIEALRTGRVIELDRPAAFVMGVCRNTVREWRKSTRRRDTLLARFGPAFDAASEPAVPLDGVRLERCLQGLGARERSIVVLTFFADAGSDQIARELGMTPTHVRVARHRAIRQLRDCMEGGA